VGSGCICLSSFVADPNITRVVQETGQLPQGALRARLMARFDAHWAVALDLSSVTEVARLPLDAPLQLHG